MLKKVFKVGCLLIILIAILTAVTIHLVHEHYINKEIKEEVKAVETAFSISDSTDFSIPEADQSIASNSIGYHQVANAEYTLDLEKTIRIFHIMDEGLSKSKDMHEYLTFLATQDYRGVPVEVLAAKKKMIPFYISIRKAEDNLEEAERNALWKSVIQSENLTSANSPLGASILAASQGFSTQQAIISLTMQAIATGKEVFENLQKNSELEKKAREALEENQEAYIEYLEKYTKVYIKYTELWNELCLARDHAYLAIHNNDFESALKQLNDLLQRFPGDRESILLKAYSMLLLKKTFPVTTEYGNDLKEVETLLNSYIEKNPNRSAPALVLLGTYNLMIGNESEAQTLYDQSSVEYPRQVEELLDMYNSYNYRNYMLKSVEGKFVMEMYRAMMEGYGFFSPNFQKAVLAYNKGDYEKAKEEVFRHFFRRGNQDVYDYLISDMTFVEKHMPKILDMIFEEHSFLDLQAYNPTMSFSDKMAIEIENRSDKHLSNVRLFICLHLTDMYKDEYIVKKMETTINDIEPHSKANFGKLQLDFELYGKKKDHFEDVVSARAIILTDSLIIWVDQDKVKKTNITEKLVKDGVQKNLFGKAKNFVYLNKSVSGTNIIEQLNSGITFKLKKKDGISGFIGSQNIVFHFPRILDAINPYFSFGELSKAESILPESVTLNGNSIDVEFEKNDSWAGKTITLYISSSYGAFCLDVSFNENGDPTKVSKVKF